MFASQEAEVESRTQRSRPGQGHKRNPRPRTDFSMTVFHEAKDRNVRGQRPRKKPASVLKKKKRKKSSQIFCKVPRVLQHKAKERS